MTIKFLEAAGAATFGLEFYNATVGTVGTEDDGAGLRRIYFGTGASQNAAVHVYDQTGQAGRLTFYYRYVSFSGTGRAWTLTFRTNAGVNSWFMAVRSSANTLEICNGADGTSFGTGSANVKDGNLHRISVAWSITSGSVNEFRVWVDGTIDITASNRTLTNTTIERLLIGEGAGTPYMRWKLERGLYIDDDSGLTDPGDIRVTAKRPNVDNTSGFDTGIGSGTNRYDRVSERPLSVTNGWQHAASSDAQENYTLQTASQGDVDITGAQIFGYTGWMYAKRGSFDASSYSFLGNTNDKTSNHTTTQITVSIVNQVGTYAAGDAIFVAFACDDDGNPGTTATCADSRGNTYSASESVQVSDTGSGSGARVALFVALNPTALQNGDTITITHGTVGASAASAASRKAVATSSAKDVSASNVINGSSGDSGATGTLASSNAVAVAAWAMEATSGDFGTQSMTNASLNIGGFLADGTSGAGAASNMSVYGIARSPDGTSGITYNVATTGSSRDQAVALGVYKCIAGGGTLGDPKLMLNGTEYSKTLTTSNALYTEIVASASYPSNAAGIGMRSSGTTADSYLYECGALIAYIPSTFSHLPIFGSRRPIGIRV